MPVKRALSTRAGACLLSHIEAFYQISLPDRQSVDNTSPIGGYSGHWVTSVRRSLPPDPHPLSPWLGKASTSPHLSWTPGVSVPSWSRPMAFLEGRNLRTRRRPPPPVTSAICGGPRQEDGEVSTAGESSDISKGERVTEG